jgi:hypothetical protein
MGSLSNFSMIHNGLAGIFAQTYDVTMVGAISMASNHFHVTLS